MVRADRVHDVTDSPLSDAQLACLPIAYGTAMGMLERAGLRKDETLLVTGASGGVGLALVQLAAARGARVVAVTSAAKAEDVREAGAAHVLPRDGGELADRISAIAPAGLDTVADVVGGPLIDAIIPLLRDDGRWVIAGAVADPVVSLDLRRLYLHNIQLIGSSMHTRPHFAAMLDATRNGDIAPVVAAGYPLNAIHDAQRRFAEGHYTGKIVVVP